MTRLRFLLAALLFATPALAAPVITSITPSQGSEFGETHLVIRGTGFIVDCPPCPLGVKPPDVFFGNQLATTIGFVDSTKLDVFTPQHAPGTVPVTVRQLDGEFVLANGFTFLREPFRMTPAEGPTSGGTAITITGDFGTWPYFITFGNMGVPSWRVDENTVVAITPPGSGRVEVKIIEYDIFRESNLFFTYRATALDDKERVLLPTFTPPLAGAHGSRFVTELRALNRSTTKAARIGGLSRACLDAVCPAVVPDPQRDTVEVPAGGELAPSDVVYNGTPARFVYLPKEEAGRIWLNLRVFDDSRTGVNFGTEMPVVRDRDLFRDTPIVFSGVPTDPAFRNTLRIYAANRMTVWLEVRFANGNGVARDVFLQAGANEFFPAYAQVGDLPTDVGPVRITITPPRAGQFDFYTPYWAFISVTNNETQLITTIRP